MNKQHYKRIQVKYRDPHFIVVLDIDGESEIVGHGLSTFYPALKLIKQYEQHYPDMEVVIDSETKNNIDIHEELSLFATELGLPADTFSGLADNIQMYLKQKENQNSDSFKEWFNSAMTIKNVQ